eukprot:3916482-Prymnesium_polylepis.1
MAGPRAVVYTQIKHPIPAPPCARRWQSVHMAVGQSTGHAPCGHARAPSASGGAEHTVLRPRGAQQAARARVCAQQLASNQC